MAMKVAMLVIVVVLASPAQAAGHEGAPAASAQYHSLQSIGPDANLPPALPPRR